MNLDELRGLYLPSYFGIRVNTTQDLHPLKDLDPRFLSTYFHEYFHFLQDITSPFGHGSAWNTFDRTIRLLHYVQQCKDQIKIPLKTNPHLVELDDNFRLQLAILLNQKPTSAYGITNFNGFEIADISLSTRPEAEKLLPGGIIRFVKLGLKNNKGIEASYQFGAVSVMETMTHLIQTKFFGPHNSPEYPYRSAIKLANRYSEQLKNNEEFIFSLCDISLQSPYPGWTFYEILISIDQQKFIPKNSEDIYTFGLAHIEKKWGLWDRFKKYKEHLINIISKLYGHELFAEDKEWLIHIIEEGYNIRMENPLFMLSLYRSSVPFSPDLLKIYDRVGAPEAINKNNKRWFASPKQLADKEDKIQTVFLLAFKQIQNSLLLGKHTCVLLDHCKSSKQKMPIDENCLKSPWLKAKKGPLCPFAALWKSFGLEEKEMTNK